MSATPASDGNEPRKLTADSFPDPEPLDPAQPPPADRFCDVVLTGGVTDGVVYPWAIIELARHYNFKNIAGTSVGAMAAALAAASEYARRRGSVAGFNEVLLKLPRKLGEDVNGRPRIFGLFQPPAQLQRIFDLFVELFSPDSAVKTGKSTFDRYVRPVLKPYRRPALMGVVTALAIGLPLLGVGWCAVKGLTWPYWLAFFAPLGIMWLALIVVLVVVFVGWELYRDIVVRMVANGFGLCKGHRIQGTPYEQSSLIEWLHEGIQRAAGKRLDQPLTFRDLWDAPAGPVPSPGESRKPRSIDLRMVTTNLTHGRPYALPLADEAARLFFKVRDLRPFFPASVIDHLVRHSRRYAPVRPEDPKPKRGTRRLRELPVEDLPVIVATRLSLSFPFLFTTVPLWAIDYEPMQPERTLRRCRFSDGGLCSNFPIHLFDSAVPEWPTFGISLQRRSIFRDKRFAVWLPELHDQGHGDSWDRFGDERSAGDVTKQVPAFTRLAGFVTAIVTTAKDWNDKTTARMPGARDRIVNVFLGKDEAGLNLKLTEAEILDLASRYGQPAGRALVDKFIGPAPDAVPTRGWSDHRWVRFNTFLIALRERITGLKTATERPAYATPLPAQIGDARLHPPLEEKPPAKPLTDAQARDLQHLLTALQELEAGMAKAKMHQPYRPVPPTNLQMRPPL